MLAFQEEPNATFQFGARIAADLVEWKAKGTHGNLAGFSDVELQEGSMSTAEVSTVGDEPACHSFVRGARRDPSKEAAKEAAGLHHSCVREDTYNYFDEKHTIARYIFLPYNAKEMAEDGRSVGRHLVAQKSPP